MAEVGQVTQVNENDVVVRLKRNEACAKCRACSAGLEGKDMIIHASNICLAKKDDWVEIQLEQSNFLKAVGIMYGMPLVGLLIGVILGSFLGQAFAPGISDLLAFVLGIAGAGIVFLTIHKNEARFHTKEYRPKVVRIVDAMDAAEACYDLGEKA